jgi:hypothetical protein
MAKSPPRAGGGLGINHLEIREDGFRRCAEAVEVETVESGRCIKAQVIVVLPPQSGGMAAPVGTGTSTPRR